MTDKLLTVIDGEYDSWVALRSIEPTATIADTVQTISCDTRDFHLGWNFEQPEMFKKASCGYEYRTNDGLQAMERMIKDGSIADCEIEPTEILTWLDRICQLSGGYEQEWRYLTARIEHCSGWDIKYIRFVRHPEKADRFIVCNSYMQPIEWRKVADAIYDPMDDSQVDKEQKASEPKHDNDEIDPNNCYSWSEPDTYVLHNYHMPPAPKPLEQKFCGPCCNRCQHRFGKTSNAHWCEQNHQRERCYRFKLEKK